MAKILLIDDSESALAQITQWLVMMGHDVTPLLSGRMALHIVQTGGFDLVITDIYMPQPDGLEILRDARRAGVSTPFIAISSKGEEFSIFRLARAYGAVSTLSKPFKKQDLQSAVESALADTLAQKTSGRDACGEAP